MSYLETFESVIEQAEMSARLDAELKLHEMRALEGQPSLGSMHDLAWTQGWAAALDCARQTLVRMRKEVNNA